MMSGVDNLGRSTEKSGDNQSVDNKSGYSGVGITSETGGKQTPRCTKTGYASGLPRSYITFLHTISSPFMDIVSQHSSGITAISGHHCPNATPLACHDIIILFRMLPPYLVFFFKKFLKSIHISDVRLILQLSK